MLNGNQLRELRTLQNYSKYTGFTFNNGWTTAQMKMRKSLLDLGYIEKIDPAATFGQYRLTTKGIEFKW